MRLNDLKALALKTRVADPEMVARAFEQSPLETRSPVLFLLEGQLVDEMLFLEGLASGLGMPWWGEPLPEISEPCGWKCPPVWHWRIDSFL